MGGESRASHKKGRGNRIADNESDGKEEGEEEEDGVGAESLTTEEEHGGDGAGASGFTKVWAGVMTRYDPLTTSFNLEYPPTPLIPLLPPPTSNCSHRHLMNNQQTEDGRTLKVEEARPQLSLKHITTQS